MLVDFKVGEDGRLGLENLHGVEGEVSRPAGCDPLVVLWWSEELWTVDRDSMRVSSNFFLQVMESRVGGGAASAAYSTVNTVVACGILAVEASAARAL